MPRGPLIHRAPALGIVLRHVRGNVHPAEFSYEFLRVVVPIPSQLHSLSRRNGFRHEQRSTPFRSSIRLGQNRLHQKPVAIFHQYMSQVAQLRLATFGLLEQLPVRVASICNGRFL